MKIALAQLNYHIGNFEKNSSKILQNIEKAKKNGVDLIIFSELSVCGYPPHDLLEQKDFILQGIITVEKIAKSCYNIAAIVGAPSINPNPEGKKLYNSAFFLNNGKIEKVINKSLLPTYDIFDEYRYFEPNSEYEILDFKGKKIALTICEDLWDDQAVDENIEREKLYVKSPMGELLKYKPDFIINIAASPFSYNKENFRQKALINKTKKYNLSIFYVNQVGAQTELIFDGGSMVVSNNGKITDYFNTFSEDYREIFLDRIIKDKTVVESINANNKIENIYNALVLGIKDYFEKTGFKKATLGLSGGIDSAVTLVLAERALGNKNLRVLLLPSKYSSEHSIKDAINLADNLNIQYDTININKIVESFESSLSTLFKDTQEDITEENIQARIRGTLLMALSNKFGNILLNTSNKSEAAVGYGTLYGDMCGGLSVLGDVYKTDVYRLANYINREKEIIPLNTIQKPPSAELRPNQLDQDSLPEYDILDNILYQYIELKKSVSEIVEKGFEKNIVEKIISLVNTNEYKRFQSPPILRISSKAFGVGRKMPLVAKY